MNQSTTTNTRVMCYRCFWPKALCWCSELQPMETRTKFLFLMHPKEYKQEKAATGRLTHLCLPNSSLHMGTSFDGDEEVQAMLGNPRFRPLLFYPGTHALNLSEITGEDGLLAGRFAELRNELKRKTLLVVILDATWSCARKMLRLSPSLQELDRVMLTPASESRYVIKQQPQAGCLSTLEAVHELLAVLDAVGLDSYDHPERLLALFARMQDFQIRCALDPSRTGYRRGPYSDPSGRKPSRVRGASRRENYLKLP